MIEAVKKTYKIVAECKVDNPNGWYTRTSVEHISRKQCTEVIKNTLLPFPDLFRNIRLETIEYFSSESGE